MDAIREQLNRPIIAGAVGFFVGILIGWFLLGWVIAPVQWTDAAPEHLRVEWQEEYLRMSIHTFNRTGSNEAARQRWAELGEEAPEIMERVQTSPGALSATDIQNFQNTVGAEVTVPEVPAETPVEVTPEPEGASFIRTLFPIMCLITFLLAGALVLVFLLRGRRGPGTITPAMEAQQAAREAEWTDYSAIGEETPMAQFMASYKLGDDLFDDSFSIDSPSGEFLGECGVGISETIGVGDPKKVTAFEVWLFDKNDIQTVTKVLMSGHAFNDDAIRQRLAAKGEPVEAAPGTQVVLETATLQLVARVVDMGYGNGALPDESFFEKMLLELAVWRK
jgi:hypothetical protein